MWQGNLKNAKAYIIGSGIASLACAVYLIREAHVKGDQIHIFEQNEVTGGALDGAGNAQEGYLIRGGRMHEKHFGCYWDLLSGIPSLTDTQKSVKQETFDFNKKVVTCSHSRMIEKGEKLDVSSYGLSKKDQYDMLRLMFHSEEALAGLRIEDWFSSGFFHTVFWKLWNTTFAFQSWSSVVEMKRYFLRFIHLLPGFNQLKGIMRTVYNQYDSVILPVETWLKEQGVQFIMNSAVSEIEFNITDKCKSVSVIQYENQRKQNSVALGDDDFAFITLGSMVEGTSIGSMNTPAVLNTNIDSGSWALWNNIAKYDSDFGSPGIFCEQVDLSKWMSFTVTMADPTFFEFMESYTGNIAGTGGLVTIKDSSWCMSVVLAWQPHFLNQPDGVYVFWGDGLLPDKKGDFIDKKMSDCTGEEILIELFSHLRILDAMKPLWEKIKCIPCIMPFIDSQFLPRSPGDRPMVVPQGAVNFAFIGQFVEVPHDCVFTVEYSVRTAQMAVFSLLGIEKKVTPVYEGIHDIHVLIEALKAVGR